MGSGLTAVTLCAAPPAEAVPALDPSVARVASATLTAAEILELSTPGLVLIEASYSDDSTGSGSGFFVGTSDTIVTCFHVIQGACHLKVWLGSVSASDVEVLRYSILDDFAVLRVRGLSGTQLPPGRADILAPGARVAAIGFPLGADLGRRPTITEGNYSGRTEGVITPPRLQISAPISPGNSGGPVFEMGGEVVGIASSALDPMLTRAQNLNFAVPIDLIRGSLVEGPPRQLSEMCRLFPRAESVQRSGDSLQTEAEILAAFKLQADRNASAIRSVIGLKRDGPLSYHAQPRTFRYTLSWWESVEPYFFNVSKVDPAVSIVSTYKGYIAVPFTEVEQRVVLKSTKNNLCDDLHYAECMTAGAVVKKTIEPRRRLRKVAFAFSYQEGRWELRRVFGPEDADDLLDDLASEGANDLWRHLIGMPR